MKLTLLHAFVALLGFFVVNFNPLHAADAAKPKGIPGRGTVEAVDAAAGTVSLESKKGPRVFSVTPTTKIKDESGKILTLGDIKAGDKVGVYYTKDASGKMTLETLNLHTGKVEDAATSKAVTPAPAPTTAAQAPTAAPTPAPATTPAAAAPEKSPATTAAPAAASGKKQKASGKVVSVDAAGGSIVIHGKADQTFTVPADAKITGAANLGAITAGQHVSATYTKGADGSMTVSALKVDK